MMISFYQIDPVLQAILLVISQFAVFFLASGTILLYKRDRRKLILSGAILTVNVILYVLMQLDSNLTGTGRGLLSRVPYVLLLLLTVLSIVIFSLILYDAIKKRRVIDKRSIKEAFDNLPAGVCFFNDSGLPVLCNHAMQRFSFAVCGKDVQFIDDLEAFLSDGFVQISEGKRNGNIFILSDGSAKRLEKRSFIHENGESFTQFVVTDVTELHERQVELEEENAQQRQVQADLKRLSANIVTATREEEILNTKMRVHDEMGRCLVAAQKYLSEGAGEMLPANIPESMISDWKRAVSMLRYNNETKDEDMLFEIRKTCEHLNLEFQKTGELPKNESAAYILTCAVRECMTNAVRYADATVLFADFTEDEDEASVTVTNNGRIPDGEIAEGGGLSTLRRRTERAGGIMTVLSSPRFRLTVTVPKRKDGYYD